MKKLIALVLVLVCVLSLVGCSDHQPNGHDTAPNPDAYIVIEVSETNLLVAEIGEDGKAIEEKQYSVPNVFHPSNKIVVGDQVIINHKSLIHIVICYMTYGLQNVKELIIDLKIIIYHN